MYTIFWLEEQVNDRGHQRRMDLKGVQSLLQQCASIPDGPAAPLVRRVADRILLAFI